MTFPSYTHFHDDGFAVGMQETTIMKISRRIKHFKSKFILFPYNAYKSDLSRYPYSHDDLCFSILTEYVLSYKI